jgi:hypothetical protein
MLAEYQFRSGSRLLMTKNVKKITTEKIKFCLIKKFQLTYPQCCGSGSGIRCLFDPWIRDLRSLIPRPYF